MGTHLNRTVTSSEDEQLQESAEGGDESDEEIKIEETTQKTPQEERLEIDFQLARAVDLIKGIDIYKESLTQ